MNEMPGFQHKDAQGEAKRLIRLLDRDGKYVPDAGYEVQGKALKEVLAGAYFAGYRDAVLNNMKPKGTRKD